MESLVAPSGRSDSAALETPSKRKGKGKAKEDPAVVELREKVAGLVLRKIEKGSLLLPGESSWLNSVLVQLRLKELTR